MELWRRVSAKWTRITVWHSAAVTTVFGVIAVIVGLIWGMSAAWAVMGFWVGAIAVVLTSDTRPLPLNTLPTLPKVRP